MCRPAPPRLSPDTSVKSTSVNERCEVWVGLRIPFQENHHAAQGDREERAGGESARRSWARSRSSSGDSRLMRVSQTRANRGGVGGGTRVSQPRHRRQRSFADAVAETVDVSKLLIPEGSQDIIWRMLFGSKTRSPPGKGGRVERAGWGFELSLIGEADGARLGRRLRRRREKIEETTRRRALLERAFRGRRGGRHAWLPRSGTRRDICRAPREASTRGVRLSAVQENLGRGVRRVARRAPRRRARRDGAAFASRRLFASAAESLFSSLSCGRGRRALEAARGVSRAGAPGAGAARGVRGGRGGARQSRARRRDGPDGSGTEKRGSGRLLFFVAEARGGERADCYRYLKGYIIKLTRTLHVTRATYVNVATLVCFRAHVTPSVVYRRFRVSPPVARAARLVSRALTARAC